MEKTVARLLLQAGDESLSLDDRNVSLRELLGLFKSDESLVSLEHVEKANFLLSALDSAAEIVVFLMAAENVPIAKSEIEEACIKGIIASSVVSICGKVYRHVSSTKNQKLLRDLVMGESSSELEKIEFVMDVLTCKPKNADDVDLKEYTHQYLILLTEILKADKSIALCSAAMFALYQISLFDDSHSPSIVSSLMEYSGECTRVLKVTLLCLLRHEKNEPFSDQLSNILKKLDTPAHQINHSRNIARRQASMNRKRPRESHGKSVDLSLVPVNLLADLIVQTAFATPQDKWNEAVLVFHAFDNEF